MLCFEDLFKYKSRWLEKTLKVLIFKENLLLGHEKRYMFIYFNKKLIFWNFWFVSYVYLHCACPKIALHQKTWKTRGFLIPVYWISLCNDLEVSGMFFILSEFYLYSTDILSTIFFVHLDIFTRLVKEQLHGISPPPSLRGGGLKIFGKIP